MICISIIISKLRSLVFLRMIKTGWSSLKFLRSRTFFHPGLPYTIRLSVFMVYVMVVTTPAAPSRSPALPSVGRPASCAIILGSFCACKETTQVHNFAIYMSLSLLVYIFFHEVKRQRIVPYHVGSNLCSSNE